ncbi:MAG TPA: type II secretion system protein [bacterium]|nr:MAG: hypothetical protein BWY14_00903 [Parcubacteria group bacterium ADurb.Bin192]HPN15286.1 type II secretion system protein [bacterium]
MKRPIFLPGQSLIEMLIVLFIIALGLFAVVSLIFSNVALQEQDADQIVATNLAREALEMVQNMRDTNWLLGDRPFDYGMLVEGAVSAPTPVVDCTVVPVWDGGAIPAPFFDATPNDLSQARVYKQGVEGYFTNTVTATSTEYQRLLTLAPICEDPNNSANKAVAEGACACPPAGFPTYTKRIGLRAKADVRWLRKNRQRNLTIYGDFYDWR